MTQNINKQYYVAPPEPPESRRPPITEVGVLKWLKENLFKNVRESIISIVTALLVITFMINFLNWALFEAQWEIAFLNLRILNVGQQFPISEVWRAETVAMIIIFLSLFSVAIWGRITRGIIGVIIFISALMIFLPILTRGVPEPPVYSWVDGSEDQRQIAFIAEEGQELSFTIDPLTTPEEFKISTLTGYIENNNQAIKTSFDSFTEADTEISFQKTRNPDEYDLAIGMQVRNGEGEVMFSSDISDSREERTFTWVAPSSGWYIYQPLLGEDSGEMGGAWLVANNLEIYRSTISAQEERISMYGEPPEFDCARCGTFVNRTDTRYQGDRSLWQWFSIQLTPFLLETRDFFFLAVFTGIIGYLTGLFFKQVKPSSLQETVERLRPPLRTLTIITFLIYLVLNLFGGVIFDIYQTLYPISVLIFVIVGGLYSINQLLDTNPSSKSNGLTMLWLVSVPAIIMIIAGATQVSALPPINNENYGGLLLTLMLSVVAIAASFPIGLALALGRQSSLPVVSILCTMFIEVLRGVPLITLLFMGRLILPFFGFGLGDVSLVIRIMVVLTLFTSAYMAEVVRGGLQIIPRGQIEAAQALGLNNFWTTYLIVLPQAIRAVIPAIMGQAVSLFKDTTLVYIVGLLEILGTMNQILGDSLTGYLAFPREGYLFIGIVFFIFSYLMADVSRRIERTGSGAIRRDTV